MHPFYNSSVYPTAKQPPWVRKCTAILLIFTFAVSQYAKQLGYFECRIANALSPVSQRCDCEKLLEDSQENTANDPVNRAHNHIHPDEYIPAATRVHTLITPANQGKNIMPPDANISKGNPTSPFHPPDIG